MIALEYVWTTKGGESCAVQHRIIAVLVQGPACTVCLSLQTFHIQDDADDVYIQILSNAYVVHTVDVEGVKVAAGGIVEERKLPAWRSERNMRRTSSRFAYRWESWTRIEDVQR